MNWGLQNDSSLSLKTWSCRRKNILPLRIHYQSRTNPLLPFAAFHSRRFVRFVPLSTLSPEPVVCTSAVQTEIDCLGLFSPWSSLSFPRPRLRQPAGSPAASPTESPTKSPTASIVHRTSCLPLKNDRLLLALWWGNGRGLTVASQYRMSLRASRLPCVDSTTVRKPHNGRGVRRSAFRAARSAFKCRVCAVRRIRSGSVRLSCLRGPARCAWPRGQLHALPNVAD